MVRIGLGSTNRHPAADHVLAKRAGMQNALKEVGLSCAGHEVEFPKNAAPRVATDCVLSLSHSASWLLCAAARPRRPDFSTRFGVDIERRRPRRFEQIGNFLGWPSRSESEAHFYRRWTLAEALFKASGAEVPAVFDQFDHVARVDDCAGAVTYVGHGWRWKVWWPSIRPGLTACVVVGVEL